MTFVATDDGVPALADTESTAITVAEAGNQAPDLVDQADTSVTEDQYLTFTLQATDPVVRPFRDKPVGEVSQVYKAPADDPDAGDAPTYRVAILTDRASPSRKAFADDEEWRLGYMPRYTRSIFVLSGWRQQMVRRAKFEFHGRKR